MQHYHSDRLICLILSAAPGAGAADFWKDKNPDQWSAAEIQRLLTDSPWARDASADFDMERFGGGGGMPPQGTPMGGLRGGPGGFPGGTPPGGPMGTPGPGMTPSLTVRWESAAPVSDARRLRDAGGASAPSIDE